MFDTHVHLNSDIFSDNEKALINSARDNDVKYFVIPGMDRTSSKKAAEIAAIYKNVFWAAGIHPTEDLESLNINTAISWIATFLEKYRKAVAIGEIGLDYYHFISAARIQKIFFEEQIKLAIMHDLAVIIHNRQASEDIIRVVNKYTGPLSKKCVFHCCEADYSLLEFARKHNFYLGVDGDLTYDTVKQEFYKDVDLQLIVLETDSPNLTPEPVKRINRYPNQPQNLKFVALKLAEIKKIPLDTVIKTTTFNAKQLFGVE